MKHANTFVLALAALTLSACGGSSGYDEPAPPPAPTPPPAATQTNFTAFMRTQIGASMTTETAAPADVETIDWAFTDDDDETEYDDVIATSL